MRIALLVGSISGFCHGIFAQDAIVASQGAIVAICRIFSMAQEAEKVGTKAKQKTNYRSVEVPHMIIPYYDKKPSQSQGAGPSVLAGLLSVIVSL